MEDKHDKYKASVPSALQAGYLPASSRMQAKPLFVVQDKDTVEAVFALVAGRAGANLTIYGVSARMLDVSSRSSLEMIAEDMISTIRALQPSGPYRLAGWSQCGLLAYEVATQLVVQGAQVEFVGLIGEHVKIEHRSCATERSLPLPVHLFVTSTDGSRDAPFGCTSWCELLSTPQIHEVSRLPGDIGEAAMSRAYARSICEAVDSVCNVTKGR